MRIGIDGLAIAVENKVAEYFDLDGDLIFERTSVTGDDLLLQPPLIELNCRVAYRPGRIAGARLGRDTHDWHV